MGGSLNKWVIFNTFQTASGNKTGLPSVSPVIYPSYWAAGYDNSQKIPAWKEKDRRYGTSHNLICRWRNSVLLQPETDFTYFTWTDQYLWCFCRLGLGEQSYIYDQAFWTFQFYSSTLPIYYTFSHYLHFSGHLKDRHLKDRNAHWWWHSFWRKLLNLASQIVNKEVPLNPKLYLLNIYPDYLVTSKIEKSLLNICFPEAKSRPNVWPVHGKKKNLVLHHNCWLEWLFTLL